MKDSFEKGEAFAHSLTHAEERKYDPAKRKEYYERTKKLKGRGKRNQMLTGEDRAAVEKDKKLVKSGKTSAKLENLQAKQEKISEARSQILVYVIQGRLDTLSAKKALDKLADQELKVKDQMWNEANNLTAKRAVKAIPGLAKKVLKSQAVKQASEIAFNPLVIEKRRYSGETSEKKRQLFIKNQLAKK